MDEVQTIAPIDAGLYCYNLIGLSKEASNQALEHEKAPCISLCQSFDTLICLK